MFVYLVWSHYDHDQAGCVAPGKLATATATAARSPHNICRSSAVPGPALPGESENTRETDSWDTENWVRGEKKSPDTFNNGLHFVNTGPCFFPSWTLCCKFRPQLNGSQLFLQFADWPWTDFAINYKHCKIDKSWDKEIYKPESKVRKKYRVPYGVNIILMMLTLLINKEFH